MAGFTANGGGSCPGALISLENFRSFCDGGFVRVSFAGKVAFAFIIDLSLFSNVPKCYSKARKERHTAAV